MDEQRRAMLIEYAQFHEDSEVRELGRELERVLLALKLQKAKLMTRYVVQHEEPAVSS